MVAGRGRPFSALTISSTTGEGNMLLAVIFLYISSPEEDDTAVEESPCSDPSWRISWRAWASSDFGS